MYHRSDDFIKLVCIETHGDSYTKGCIYYAYPYYTNHVGYNIFINNSFIDGGFTYIRKNNNVPGNGGSYMGLTKKEMDKYFITLMESREQRINKILE